MHLNCVSKSLWHCGLPEGLSIVYFNFSASDCMREASVIFHQIRSLADYLSGGLKKRSCGVWAGNVRVESIYIYTYFIYLHIYIYTHRYTCIFYMSSKMNMTLVMVVSFQSCFVYYPFALAYRSGVFVTCSFQTPFHPTAHKGHRTTGCY